MAIQSWVTSFGGLTSRLKQLKVEEFQRPYSWTKDQVARLFEEHFNALVDSGTPSVDPFFGTVVVMPLEGNEKVYSIIDGQQRCSTITMIYAEAARALAETGKTFDHDSAEKFFYSAKGTPWIQMKDEDDLIYQVLTLPKGDRSEISDLHEEAIDNLIKKGHKTSGAICFISEIIIRQIEGYCDLAAKKKKNKAEALKLLLEAIRDKFKIVVVEVDGAGQGLAVFESLNTAGLPLTLEQLIRNCLMKAFNTPAYHKTISQYWDANSRNSFHSKIGDANHRTEFLMQYYAAFHGSILKKNAYHQYKRLASEVHQGKHHKSLDIWLDHMQEAWSFYEDYSGPLKSLGGKVVYPLLLLTNQLEWKSQQDRQEAVDRVAFALEAALLRTQICKDNLSVLDTHTVEVCEAIRNGTNSNIKTPSDLEALIRKKFSGVAPNDSNFEKAIRTAEFKPKNRRTKLMLHRINHAIRNKFKLGHQYQGDGGKVVNFVYAHVPLANPSPELINKLGFDDFAHYQILTSSLANIIMSPPMAKAALVPCNYGLSSFNVDAKILEKRSKELAKDAIKIWHL